MNQTYQTTPIDGHLERVITRSPHDASRSAAIYEFTEPVPYADAWKLQKQLHEDRVADRRPDTLVLLEHLPVYTAGRTTHASHWSCRETDLHDPGPQVYPVDRGGALTYHGPGQLVGYPILRLAHYASGPRQYVRLLEDAIIGTLRLWKIQGYRVDKKPGVWVQFPEQEAKIAAIGVRIERAVTLHGFALNVDMDLSPFSRIVPCGLADCRVTSMAEAIGSTVSLSAVRSALRHIFSHTFNLEWTSVTSGPSEERGPTR